MAVCIHWAILFPVLYLACVRYQPNNQFPARCSGCCGSFTLTESQMSCVKLMESITDPTSTCGNGLEPGSEERCGGASGDLAILLARPLNSSFARV